MNFIDTQNINGRRFFTITDENNNNPYNVYKYKTGINVSSESHCSEIKYDFREEAKSGPVFFDTSKIFDKVFSHNTYKLTNKIIKGKSEIFIEKGYFPCHNFLREVFLPIDKSNVQMIYFPNTQHYTATEIVLSDPIDLSNIDTIKMLISIGACPNRHLLRFAVSSGYLNLAQYLIDDIGIDFSSLYQYHTELSIASFRGHIDIVKYLIQKNIDVNAYNYLALEASTFNGHVDIFKLLLNNGADLGNSYRTILADMCVKGHLKYINGKIESKPISDSNLRGYTEIAHIIISMY
ncbi:repeat protein [Moumouvirus goulette]|uniref:Repeat protein n=1 Tax=Moumouvirus goulette TaxID=1247379 RepID=M1NLU8_9VIRU|nr:repeat protein [Moumouvirus goulette]AGF84970.1 repeat protein [Moumouvirus goulette]